MNITPSILPANTHIHTPYSFAAFESVEEAVSCAKNENIAALGISDFNTIDGFDEFTQCCGRFSVYPLYNIEFIALLAGDKRAGLRWNDPRNPGIMYFCGKALRYPPALSTDSRNTLASLWKATQDYIWQVVDKTNAVCRTAGVPVVLDYCTIRAAFAKNTVRERHVAKALYHEFVKRWPDPQEQLVNYRTLFGDRSYNGPVSDAVTMQNDIRDRLLKAGRPAYVEEKEDAFLQLADVMKIILQMSGIPCYPVLVDDSLGLNEYEQEPDRLADLLASMNIHAVEFIPLRNTLAHLRKYVLNFHRRGFCITFGTEHNTPKKIPLIPSTRGGIPFDEELQRIAYRGACILAAHQERCKNGLSGFIGAGGKRLIENSDLAEFASLGDRAIRATLGEKPDRMDLR